MKLSRFIVALVAAGSLAVPAVASAQPIQAVHVARGVVALHQATAGEPADFRAAFRDFRRAMRSVPHNVLLYRQALKQMRADRNLPREEGTSGYEYDPAHVYNGTFEAATNPDGSIAWLFAWMTGTPVSAPIINENPNPGGYYTVALILPSGKAFIFEVQMP